MRELLHNNLRISARAFPNRIAYKCQDRQWTFQELDNKAGQLAGQLVEWGLSPGDRVGIFLNRCIESPLSVYAVLKAGGVFVPMDPMAPSTRNEYVTHEVDMKVIITHPSQRFFLRKLNLSDSSVKGIIGGQMDGIPSISWEDVWNRDEQDCHVEVEEGDPAYIMFTSGSTGTPKGIVHTHRSGNAYARLSQELYEVNEQDVVANHSPLHFDISTFGYFTTVRAGATTILCSDAYIKMPASLARLIEQEAMTIWYSVPLALIQMLETETLPDLDWSSLRWVLFGGEPFPPELVRKIMSFTPRATWCNVYGPAEVNQCSFFHFNHVEDSWDAIPLGQIWSETDYLLDEGELLIASPTQMWGYWKDEERSQAAFFHQGGKRYYRTGDLVREDEEGLLHFIGRKDRQVKIRGYRVELEEIEARLSDLEGVELAIAFAIGEGPGQKKIAAAVQSVNQDGEKELRDYLKNKIPPYALPELYIFVEEMPRTAAGKVDYKKLAEWAQSKL